MSAMPLSKQTIWDAAAKVKGPDGRDLVASASIQWATACDASASCRIHLAKVLPSDAAAFGRVAQDLAARVREVAPLDTFLVDFVDSHGTVIHSVRDGKSSSPAQPAQPQSAGQSAAGGHTPIGGLGRSGAPSPQGVAPSMVGVRHVIAVGAGKGGVGKSSIALNLAVGLARRGHAVGLLDGDIYGPSMPTMLALQNLDPVVHQGMLQPFHVHGIRCMTLGKLVEPDKPLIWRGPMAHGAFKQLVEQTEWGELDFLIIDLPPGTGDVSLTMSQVLRLSGAVVVCTPQKVAQDDAVRAAHMFEQLQVPVLGVVENMSAFIGDDGKSYEIFGRGGAEQMAQRLGLPFLGAVPLTMSLRVNSDSGNPTANFTGTDAPGIALKDALQRMVDTFEGQLALANVRSGTKRPTLSIS